jgi:hypothetical protein
MVRRVAGESALLLLAGSVDVMPEYICANQVSSTLMVEAD